MVSIIPVAATGRQDIDGILWGWKWGTREITYAFPSSSAPYLNNGYAGVFEFESFNAAQRAAIKSIVANIASFTGLTFRDSTSSNEVGLLRYAEASQINYSNDPSVTTFTGWHKPGSSTAEANPPELGFNGRPPSTNPVAQGDGWYSHTLYDNPRQGSFAYASGLMHETGHNLGLKHGHITQFGHGTLFPMLPADHNSFEYSVMTYSQYPGDPGGDDTAFDHPTTYMQDDILALQTLYGANYKHQNGNTVYQWSLKTGEMIVNGKGQGAAEDNHILMTVWDGGGTDTYDLSNTTNGAVIDLRPGAWTTVSKAQLADLGTGQNGGVHHFARGTVANALLFQGDARSLIENAVGGTGRDTLVGNQANNRLDGGKGADAMDGLGGNDTYIVDIASDRVVERTGQGRDTVIAKVSYALAAGQEIETLQLVAGRTALNLEGNEFANTLIGNDGANTLGGGLGADVLAGRGGADVFLFKTRLGGSNVDHLTDFSVRDDTIRLSDDVFRALAPGALAASAFRTIKDAKAAVDGNDHVLYVQKTGELFYDSDGGNAGGRTKFAIVDTHAALTHGDFLVV